MTHKELIEQFRDGIFALRTRRFGSVAEIMIKRLYKLDDSRKLNYDKYDAVNQKKIEIKFSTVMKENDDRIRDNNVIDQCLKANLANRAMPYEQIDFSNFDCNIQQVKRKEFDILYYGLFFADKIEIFKMTASEVVNVPGYSDWQHSGNKGEGQFHINNKTYPDHKEKHFEQELTYAELYNLLSK